MEKKLSCCGILCSECPAYIATMEDDDEKREETANIWSQQYNSEIKPQDINCLGCLQKEGAVFSYCHICGIRSCCFENEIDNCAHCFNYPCEKIEEFFVAAPFAKEKLDEENKKIREKI